MVGAKLDSAKEGELISLSFFYPFLFFLDSTSGSTSHLELLSVLFHDILKLYQHILEVVKVILTRTCSHPIFIPQMTLRKWRLTGIALTSAFRVSASGPDVASLVTVDGERKNGTKLLKRQ